MGSLFKVDEMDNSWVSNSLLRYGISTFGLGSLAVNIWNLLNHHRTIWSALQALWAVFRALKSLPQVAKAAGLISLAYLWHLPFLLILSVPVPRILCYVVYIFSDLQICFFAFMAEEAFRVLKKRIMEYYKLLVKTSSDGQLYLDEPCLKQNRNPGMNLANLRKVHCELAQLMRSVNDVYSLAAVLITLACRFFITLYLYRWIASGFIVHQLVYAILTFNRIFYVCYRFEALKRVDKSTADMINGLDKSPLDSKSRAEFKLFLIQLKSHPIVFNSYEMFNLDFTLITSTFTTTITYLMLLQQFR